MFLHKAVSLHEKRQVVICLLRLMGAPVRFFLGSEIAMLDFVKLVVCFVGAGLFVGAPCFVIWLLAAPLSSLATPNELEDARWRRYVSHTWWALGHLFAVAAGVVAATSYCQPVWSAWILAAAGVWLFAVAWFRAWNLSERELAVRRERNYAEWDVISSVSGNGGILLLTTVGFVMICAGFVGAGQYSSEERLRRSLPNLQGRAEELFDRIDHNRTGRIYPDELEQAVFASNLSPAEHEVAVVLRDHFHVFSHSIGYQRSGKFTLEVFVIDRQDVASITQRAQRYLSR